MSVDNPFILKAAANAGLAVELAKVRELEYVRTVGGQRIEPHRRLSDAWMLVDAYQGVTQITARPGMLLVTVGEGPGLGECATISTMPNALARAITTAFFLLKQ